MGAITTFFKQVGLTSNDIGIKINSRGILKEVMEKLGVPEEKFAATCVLVDKLEKVDLETLKSDFYNLGLDDSVINSLVDILSKKDLQALESTLSTDSPALLQLKQLLTFAEGYGYEDWLVVDPSVVRGLSYYTGIVFEAFDKEGKFRAICGGGRYDRILEIFDTKNENIPAVGFGFGDAVIAELLSSKNLLPQELQQANLDVVIFAMDEGDEFKTSAIEVAQQ